MSLEVALAVAMSAISLGGIIYGFGYKWGGLQTKVECLWDVYVKTALTSAVEKGVIKIGNPSIMVSGDVKEECDKVFLDSGVQSKIREMKSKRFKSAGERALFLEQKVGEDLKKISIEKGVAYPTVFAVALCLLDQ